jgi:hypothetical protein
VVVVEQDGEQEEIKVHRMLLESRSPFFRGMLESNMAEAQQGRYVVRDMLAPVVKAVLYFIYTGGPAGMRMTGHSYATASGALPVNCVISCMR